MPAVKGPRKFDFFKRDENTLPFFSIHPKTKIGTVLRVVLLGFMVFVIILNLVANYAKITLAKATTLYPLTYVIPALLVLALIIVALFKRMRMPFTKLLVGIASAILVILAISFVSAYMNLLPLLMLSENEASLPEVYARVSADDGENKHALVLMQQYARPDGSVEVKTAEGVTDLVCPYKVDAVLITVSSDDKDISIDGAIYVLASDRDKLEIEWTSENTARISLPDSASTLIPYELIGSMNVGRNDAGYYYVLKDEASVNYGDISVGDNTSSFFKSSSNAQNTHTIRLHQVETSVYRPQSVYAMTPESLKRVYTAYPSLLFNWFVKTDTLTAGTIVNADGTVTETGGYIEVEPYGSLEIGEGSISFGENDTITITPGAASVGARGSITLHMNEKEGEVTKGEAEPRNVQPPVEGGRRAYSEITVTFGE